MYNYENSLSECWNVNKIINLEGQKMYRYFLGAFGNKSFIRPQYEIMEDGKLKLSLEKLYGQKVIGTGRIIKSYREIRILC